MKRLWVWMGLGLLLAGRAGAQSSIQALEDDLKEVKQHHDDASSQAVTTFLGSLDSASQSAQTALELYKNAGGSLPDLAPVTKHYEYETPTEKAQREAIDDQNYAAAAIVAQVHCALMRNAAMLVLQSKEPNVRDQWVAWLKSIGPIYPRLAGARALKQVAMRDSVITHYLGFTGWGKSEEGGWSISSLPELYRDQVLEPLRSKPTQDTLDAWDIYIAMVHADEPDETKFAQEIDPPLEFERASDDFAFEPTMEKLGTLDQIIKANQASDHLDDWIARMRQMIATYQASAPGHSSVPGPTPGTPSSGSGAPTPTATPGTASSGGTAPTPTATPGAPVSGGGAPTPTATPGTPSSGGTSPTPTAQ